MALTGEPVEGVAKFRAHWTVDPRLPSSQSNVLLLQHVVVPLKNGVIHERLITEVPPRQAPESRPAARKISCLLGRGAVPRPQANVNRLIETIDRPETIKNTNAVIALMCA